MPNDPSTERHSRFSPLRSLLACSLALVLLASSGVAAHGPFAMAFLEWCLQPDT